MTRGGSQVRRGPFCEPTIDDDPNGTRIELLLYRKEN
jgi:hypothetical protein